MIRPPPRSTRTDTLCPYTTLFRSPVVMAAAEARRFGGGPGWLVRGTEAQGGAVRRQREVDGEGGQLADQHREVGPHGRLATGEADRVDAVAQIGRAHV